MRTKIIVIALMFLLVITSAAAIPVFPGAEGYGTDTVAGRGGQIIRVTNLNINGAGSLRECVEASGARICVFEVSGTIEDGQYLIIINPLITIAGLAPTLSTIKDSTSAAARIVSGAGNGNGREATRMLVGFPPKLTDASKRLSSR